MQFCRNQTGHCWWQAFDNGNNPQCKLCLFPEETVEQVLTQCRATADTHGRLLPELMNTVLQVQPNCAILSTPLQLQYLTQFLLDCTSLNLPATFRVPAHNPHVFKIFAVSRNWCYAINSVRKRLLFKQKKR